ncbi:MAG: YqeG family HAD IIIA-type phosphatase [Armatimonadetes bacterium]|nr:YqeG family HAD IIIA-type phosphatase [Armatimonadota bacterium]
MMPLWRLVAPRHRAAGAYRLSPSVLGAWGIEALMLDLDNTLVAWNETIPPPQVRAWVEDLHQARIPACVVSNNLTYRVRAVAELLALPFAHGRFKPSAAKLRRALAVMGTAPERTAMVGDQLFTDVLAGNRLGVPTVLVAPLDPHESFRIRMVRALERRVLAALVKRGLAPAAPEV